jgi:hypothetical protein
MLRIIVLKFVNFFGNDAVVQSLEKYAQVKSDYYRGFIEDEPSKPICPSGLGIYDIAIWSYAVNLYDYFFFSILGTIAFLAMLGHIALRLVLMFF